MEKHFVSAVFDGNIVIDKPVGIDTHSGQGIVIRLKEVLYKIIISAKTAVYGMKFALLAEGKLHIIIGAVVGENIPVFFIQSGIDMSLLIDSCGNKPKLLKKSRCQLMHDLKVHSPVLKIDDRHFYFNTDIASCFVFGRSDIAVIKAAHYFFFRHIISLLTDWQKYGRAASCFLHFRYIHAHGLFLF